MRAPTPTLVAIAVLLGSCKTEPDFVARTTPPSCDLRSQLVRRGYPENLDQILIPGNCTATRTPGMRGPDFSFWLAGRRTPWAGCASPEFTQFEPMFWTESGPDGMITRVHFCPEFCEELRQQLIEELEKDVACQRDAGVLEPDEAGQPTFPIPNGGVTAAGSGAAGAVGSSAGAGAAGMAGAPLAGAGGMPGAAGAGAGGPAAGMAAGSSGAAAGMAAAAGTGPAAGSGVPAAGSGVPAAGSGAPAAGAGAAAGTGGPAAGTQGSAFPAWP